MEEGLLYRLCFDVIRKKDTVSNKLKEIFRQYIAEL